MHVSQRVVSVAAFACSPIKDELQQLGEGCDGRLLEPCVVRANWNAISICRTCPAVRVFLETKRLFPAETSAADVAPRVQTLQHW